MKETIKVENVYKKFKDKVVLNDINLSLENGSVYGFVGPNGCGKSVLFKIICGFIRPTTGSVYVNNKKIGEDIDFIQNAGIIIETPNFMEDLSGFANLKILAEINNKISNEDIISILESLELLEHKDRKVKTYSLGMKQKLRIAQAIMEKPDILILDEPTNSLDEKSVKIVTDILKSFSSNGGMLLLTSHHSYEINELCDIIFHLENGTIKETEEK